MKYNVIKCNKNKIVQSYLSIKCQTWRPLNCRMCLLCVCVYLNIVSINKYLNYLCITSPLKSLLSTLFKKILKLLFYAQIKKLMLVKIIKKLEKITKVDKCNSMETFIVFFYRFLMLSM